MKQKKIPMRKCVGCQEMRQKKELIRVVRTPETEILIDPSGKKSGRGAYLCQSGDCLQLAKKRRSLEKALEVKISEEIYQQLQLELDKRNEQLK